MFEINKLDVFEDIFGGLEDWCILFNNFAVVFFLYIKFIFAFMLICVGVLTILKLRGLHQVGKRKLGDEDLEGKNFRKRSRLFLGSFYVTMGIGIIFNFIIYFLIFCLDWLPDRFIFDFISFSDKIDPKSINRIKDIENSKYPHEKTIYYCVAMVSFVAILDVLFSIAYITNSSGNNHRKTITQLVGGIILGMLVGWTTCLPLFL
ncbi:MAG TPA: hypothetical protein VGB37_05575 [Candidatus Lokiarchaeia archaeon]